MTHEDMERAIEFIIGHSADIDTKIDRLLEHSAKTDTRIDRLTESIQAMQVHADSDRAETREAISNLIIANESTRELASQVARLATATSQRVAKLEEKAS